MSFKAASQATKSLLEKKLKGLDRENAEAERDSYLILSKFFL